MALSSIFGASNHIIRQLLKVSTARGLSTTACDFGPDARDKRRGHLVQSDRVEGEHGVIAASASSFELVDERLMDKVIDGMRFKDIPIIHIVCTRNNTKIGLYRADGQMVARKSGGTEGYKNCRKGTTVAAQAVASRVITVATDNQIDTIRLVFNGLGPGRNAAYKVFEMSNLNIVSLSDRTEAVEPWLKRPRKAKRI